MMKKFILSTILGIGSFINAQIVNIPDANFKASLLAKSEINTNGDNQIQVSEAIAFTGILVCGSENITNLAGIEAFVNITGLWCMQNQLTTLDISKNIALTSLDCSANQLTSLDVTKNINLLQIGCYRNPLTSLNISQNTALEVLICYGSQLINLDTSKNLALKELYCYRNQIISLELNNNLQLTKLYCDENKLEFLDLSKNTALTDVWCDKNLIRILNLKNGQNPKIINLNATNNSSQTCIIVDNVANAYSYSGWKKDATASYNLACTLAINESSKKGILIFPNPAKDILNFTEEMSNIKMTDFSGKVVKQISNSEKSVNVSKFAKGSYIITATSKSGELINKKFIKE